ncbi:MAG: hypothetical protein U0892_15730 [Pirellulales bacterium]
MQPEGKVSRIVIGVDEAGYGPNIGPLIVAATAWRVPYGITEKQLVASMADSFRPVPWSMGADHIPLGDSKKLYTPATGLRSLEAGLIAMLGQIHPVPQRFEEFLQSLGVGSEVGGVGRSSGFAEWHLPQDLKVPSHVEQEELAHLTEQAARELNKRGFELLDARARVVTEFEFNRAVAAYGSKGRLLSEVTMDLTKELVSSFDGFPVEVFCDRQGGRKKYSSVLMQAMPDEWFDVLGEQDARSSYRRRRDPECLVHFSVGGDSFPATALASMIAKYLRERFMEILNRYWQQHLPNLQPTAGYPTDAKRFREAIASCADALGHSAEQWWRVC